MTYSTQLNCGMCGRRRVQGLTCSECGSAFVVVDEITRVYEYNEPVIDWGERRRGPRMRRNEEGLMPYSWARLSQEVRTPKWVVLDSHDNVVAYATSEPWAKHISRLLNLHKEPSDVASTPTPT